MNNILVIKHGALGDLITATGAFAGIRKHHPDAHIVLLTQSNYQSLAEQMPYFDEIWCDDRPKVWRHPIQYFRTIQRLCHDRPWTRVYDLQASTRTALYFKQFKHPHPEWVGKVPGCSHPRPFQDGIHSVHESNCLHLATAGIHPLPAPQVDWLTASSSTEPLPAHPFVLAIPGCSPKHPEKRWTPEGYASLAKTLWETRKIKVVLTGGPSDRPFINSILKMADSNTVEDYCERSPLPTLAELGRHALASVGSDTGPMHLVCATGCPALVLFSSATQPQLCAPPGEHIHTLQKNHLSELKPEEVLSELNPLLSNL